MRILVVEDEQKVANALKEGLEEERYEVDLAYTGEDAFFRVNTEKFDLILLDLMLPGRDGLQILTSIRKRGVETPVLLLTAREFELLEYLLRHEGQIVMRDMLAREVWKETTRGTPLNNVIDVHIARLRRKIDVDQPVKLIHTVRGVGFMLRQGEP